MVNAGACRTGTCSRSTAVRLASCSSAGDARAGSMNSPPTAAVAAPRKPLREISDLVRWLMSMRARLELGAPIRPVDVRLECLHRVGVRIESHAFVGLLDAPVDHVSQRRKLADLFLELGELVRVDVGRKGMAHGAGHPRSRQLHAHLRLGLGVSVEEQIADPHLLEEDLLEHLELLGCVLVLVGPRLRGDEEEQSERSGPRNPDRSGRCHRGFSVVGARLFEASTMGGVSASANRGCKTWLWLSPHPESAVAVA